ncbi:MAG: hypothetical protein GPI99_17060 [Microcystis aeruginosa W13-15]|nr:hypothetical protein [Microcystis aeruginosa W13-15]
MIKKIISDSFFSISFLYFIFSLNCNSSRSNYRFESISPGVSSEFEINNPFIDSENVKFSLLNRIKLYEIKSIHQLNEILFDINATNLTVYQIHSDINFAQKDYFLMIELYSSNLKNGFNFKEVYKDERPGNIAASYNFDYLIRSTRRVRKTIIFNDKNRIPEELILNPPENNFYESGLVRTKRYILSFDKIEKRNSRMRLKFDDDSIVFNILK